MGYKIGIVYRITKIDDPTINYVGSTFTTLRQRWQTHKLKFNNNCNGCSIGEYFDKYGIDKFKIILIKEYKVCAENQKDNKHLRAYEQLWINKFKLKNCCINKLDTFRLLYKQKISKRNKDYYQTNKEKLKEYKKNYYQTNKEKKKKK